MVQYIISILQQTNQIQESGIWPESSLDFDVYDGVFLDTEQEEEENQISVPQDQTNAGSILVSFDDQDLDDTLDVRANVTSFFENESQFQDWVLSN
jgi:hypothetical protein